MIFQKNYKDYLPKKFSISFQSYLALIFLSAIWGSSFLFIKLSIIAIPPSLLTFYRLLIASLFLYFFCNKVEITKMMFDNKFLFFCIAIFGNVIPFNLISYSEIFVDSIVASTLIGTMPMFTFLISFFLTKNKGLNTLSLLGIIFGFLGMIVFIDSPNLFNQVLEIKFHALIVLSSIFYALSANLVKKVKNYSPLSVATFSSILATVLSLPILFFNLINSENYLSNILENLTYKSLISATILGILCTGLAILVFFHLIRTRTAVFASQSNYLIPCFGSLWAFLFLNESLTSNMMYGLILIVVGGWLVNKSMV